MAPIAVALLGACVNPTPGADGALPDDTGTTPMEPPAPGRAPAPLARPADLRVDVLVVGAGPAGLAAALEALEAGATVAVLEREAVYGGAASWAGALMLFSGTEEQAAAGISDSADTLLAEWPEITGGDPDDPWVQAFARRNVPDVHDWLSDLGVTFNSPITDPSSGTTTRVHQVNGGGPALVGAIAAALTGETIRYEAEATALLQDASGRVIGLSWRDLALDEPRVARAGAVIVATGGFLHDLERVRTERPDLADHDLRWASWPGADGNGLAMVEAVGAATENLGAIGIYAHGVPSPNLYDELLFGALARVPWLNQDGLRFLDESKTNGFETGARRAEEASVWAILDEASASNDTFRPNDPGGERYGIEDLVAAGVAIERDDVPALATGLGLDPAVVEAEIQTFNDAVVGLAPDPFRDGTASASPIVAPPFYAVPVALGIAKAFGGVDVDDRGRVLRAEGGLIPGLYAAGELTGMAGGTLVGELGFTGSLSAVVLGGRVAGAAAAAEVLED